MTNPPDHSAADTHHTGPDARTVELLLALTDYRTAEQAMRMRTRKSMRMGATDLQALRFLLKAQGEDRIVTSRDLASHLGMTSASMTAMLDRLVAGGHAHRQPHPTDRRSISVIASIGSDEEVRQTLGAMHHRLLDVAMKLTPAQSLTITSFLDAATESAHSIDPALPTP